MATNLRFDNLTVAGTAIATTAFVSHSGRLTLTGDDGAVSTADGRVHNFRRMINKRGECQIYGDGKAYETDGPSLGVACVFKRGTSTVQTWTATVASVYNTNDLTSRLTFIGDPSTS